MDKLEELFGRLDKAMDRAAGILPKEDDGEPEDAAVLTTKKRNKLQTQTFAYPKQRKMPLSDANHVRSAMSRFGSVKGVSEAEKKAAYKKVLAAAKKFGVNAFGFMAKWGKKYG